MNNAPRIDTEQLESDFGRLRSGERSALNDLLEHAGSRLRHLTRKMLLTFPEVRRSEQTDDVLQSACLRLSQALSIVMPENLRHFFRLAALQIRRELLELSRGARGIDNLGSRPASEPGLRISPELNTHNPLKLAEWTELHEQIAALPDLERETVELLLYHGLPQADVARLMQVDVRSVKRYWQRARLALHGRLK